MAKAKRKKPAKTVHKKVFDSVKVEKSRFQFIIKREDMTTSREQTREDYPQSQEEAVVDL